MRKQKGLVDDVRKLTLVFAVLIICLGVCIPPVYAAEEISEYFTVTLSGEKYTCLGPGDAFSETFTVKNTHDETLMVRLHHVENVDNSPLYSVLKAGWENETGDIVYGSFDDLATNTAWYQVDPGSDVELSLGMFFPEECKNANQGTHLTAKFVFETRVPDGAADTPQTGDAANLLLWGGMAVGSGAAIIILLLIKKRKKERQA